MPAKKNTTPNAATALENLLRAAEGLMEARRDQMLTSIEWDALNSAVAAGRRVMPAVPTEPAEMPATLKIKKSERSRLSGGTWVEGTIAGHRFQALVFPEHATNASFELGQSRISKLWVEEMNPRRQVAAFERCWDLAPATDTAQQIVDLLAADLAEKAFGK